MPVQLEPLQARIGYAFKDANLLSLALKQASCRNDGIPTNERLELLGDRVAGLVITEAIYEKYPEFNEHKITCMCHRLLSNASMARHAAAIELGRFITFGMAYRFESQGESTKQWILADAFEALIGAMKLDGGLDVVKSFLLREFASDLTDTAPLDNPKGELNELVNSVFGIDPKYRNIPVGNRGTQLICSHVMCGDERLGGGTGQNAKEAETNAALNALNRLARKKIKRKKQ